jgi:hypothetical protein
MKEVLQGMVQSGQDIADGIEERTVVRLTEPGIDKLKTLAETGRTENEKRVAELLLASGIKAATVSVR